MWERKPLPISYIRRERPSTPSAHMARPVRLSPRTGLLFCGLFRTGLTFTQPSQRRTMPSHLGANARAASPGKRKRSIIALRLLDRSKVLHKIMLSRRVESSLLGSASVTFFAGWYMTHRTDVAPGRDLGLDFGPRWRLLAERRLEYLTELFESGRWRRYYTERAFLDDIRQAKAAVAQWRNLSERPVVPEDKRNGDARAAEPAAPIIVETPKAAVPIALSAAAASDDMLPAPAPQRADGDEPGMSPERYPLLRNML
jgi:hypothetical protein